MRVTGLQVGDLYNKLSGGTINWVMVLSYRNKRWKEIGYCFFRNTSSWPLFGLDVQASCALSAPYDAP